jgi:hypothetical protein
LETGGEELTWDCWLVWEDNISVNLEKIGYPA